MYWTTSGSRSSVSCPACSFVFSVSATPSGGTCTGNPLSYTVGYSPAGSYASYPIMVVNYAGGWYYYGQASYSGGFLSYDFFFADPYYYYYYYSSSSATLSP